MADGRRLDVVLIGPPGAGKGTQATLLADREGLRHLSTGDLLRQAVAAGSPLGLEVKAVIESGRLVPDALVLGLVEARLGGATESGILFDGFPRNVSQARLLATLLAKQGLAPAVVIQVSVPDDEVVRRLASRRTCGRCGPQPPGRDECPTCGQALTIRADDREEVVRERLRVYAEQTSPLVDFYGDEGLLRVVDGLGDTQSVAGRIAAAIEGARREFGVPS